MSEADYTETLTTDEQRQRIAEMDDHDLEKADQFGDRATRKVLLGGRLARECSRIEAIEQYRAAIEDCQTAIDVLEHKVAQHTFEDGRGVLVTLDGERMDYYDSYDHGIQLDQHFEDGEWLLVPVNFTNMVFDVEMGYLHGEDDIEKAQIPFTLDAKSATAHRFVADHDEYDYVVEVTRTEAVEA